MPWYAYQRGGWQIAVDAINHRDAAQYMRWHVPAAEFKGELIPPSMAHPSMATAMITPRREEEIRRYYERERMG